MSETNKAITPELSVQMLPGSFPGDLGIELTEITDEHVRGRMLVDRRHLHPMGYVHGGGAHKQRRSALPLGQPAQTAA